MADAPRRFQGILGEELITLDQGSRIPTRPTRQRLIHWMRLGVKARNGRRIFLETRKVGGVVYTSLEAVERFINACSESE